MMYPPLSNEKELCPISSGAAAYGNLQLLQDQNTHHARTSYERCNREQPFFKLSNAGALTVRLFRLVVPWLV